MNVEKWVDGRMALLQSKRGWRPDAAKAFAAVHERDRVFHVRRRRWFLVTIAASLASLSVLAIPGRCDSPGATSCGQPLAGRLWNHVFTKPTPIRVAALPAPTTTGAPIPPPPSLVAQNQKPAEPAAPHSQRTVPAPAPAAVHFQETGDPSAKIVCEIFTDYECPHCAILYQQIVPALITQYVDTGKVRLLHRDFPLPQHAYARLAARYANAAGRLGHYDAVVNTLFQKQSTWSADGSVDRIVAQVLAPDVMQKVRDMVEHDATLEDSINTDVQLALADGLRQTPTLVIVYQGQRQQIPGVPDYTLLQNYLDRLLSK